MHIKNLPKHINIFLIKKNLEHLYFHKSLEYSYILESCMTKILVLKGIYILIFYF